MTDPIWIDPHGTVHEVFTHLIGVLELIDDGLVDPLKYVTREKWDRSHSEQELEETVGVIGEGMIVDGWARIRSPFGIDATLDAIRKHEETIVELLIKVREYERSDVDLIKRRKQSFWVDLRDSEGFVTAFSVADSDVFDDGLVESITRELRFRKAIKREFSSQAKRERFGRSSGRGWWGERERHSEVARRGHARR